MAIRKATIAVSYRNSRTNKSYGLESRVEEVSLTDNAVGGEGDSIDITLYDKDHKMLGEYYPGKDDILSCTVSFKDSRGRARVIGSQTFHVDQFGYSGSSKFTLRGISVPKNSEFSKTPKTKTWQNIYHWAIIDQICKSYGLKLVYESGTFNPYLKKVEQSNTNDLSFIYNLAQTYGNGFKIYSDKVVVFPEENYEKKAAVATITKGDIIEDSFSARIDLIRQYTGYVYEYTNNKGGRTRMGVFFKTTPSIMIEVGFDDSEQIGIMKGRAKVNEANRDMEIINFSILGNPDMVSMATFNLSGFGGLNGKYYINKVVNNFSASGGFTQDIEARRIQQRL